jgi:hypothetical protein
MNKHCNCDSWNSELPCDVILGTSDVLLTTAEIWENTAVLKFIADTVAYSEK